MKPTFGSQTERKAYEIPSRYPVAIDFSEDFLRIETTCTRANGAWFQLYEGLVKIGDNRKGSYRCVPATRENVGKATDWLSNRVVDVHDDKANLCQWLSCLSGGDRY